MSNDDETVERVARAIAMHKTPAYADDKIWAEDIEWQRRRIDPAASFNLARAALSAMLPRDELLREALDALQGLHDDVVEYVTLNKLHDADGSPAINNHWMRRARAAADKIRAVMETIDE